MDHLKMAVIKASSQGHCGGSQGAVQSVALEGPTTLVMLARGRWGHELFPKVQPHKALHAHISPFGCVP